MGEMREMGPGGLTTDCADGTDGLDAEVGVRIAEWKIFISDLLFLSFLCGR
jgi:hypothetical protein